MTPVDQAQLPLPLPLATGVAECALAPSRAPARSPARPRDPQNLDDAELLDLITEHGSALCKKYGGLRAALELSETELAREGLNASERTRVRAALEIGQRFITATINRGEFLTSPTASRNAIMARLRDRRHEVFAVLFLTNRHQVINYEEMFRGTIDGAAVYPREVAVRALEVNAAALIVAHNHPSGVAEPSRSDRAITTKLRAALALIEVRLLDHFVVGDGQVVSFAERGWL